MGLLKRVSSCRLWRLLIVTGVPYLFCCLLNPLFFDASGWSLVSVQIYGWLFACLFIYLCAIIPYVGIILYAACGFVFVVLMYARLFYGYVLSDELIYSMFQTNSKELSGFINGAFLAFVVGEMALLIVLYYGFRNVCGRMLLVSCRRKIWLGACVFSCIMLVYSVPSILFFRIPWGNLPVRENIVRYLSHKEYRWHPFFHLNDQRPPFEPFMEGYRMPFSQIKSLYKGTKEYFSDLDLLESAAFESSCAANDDLIFVLVLGESTRADHFGMLGYSRNTTPCLSSIPGIHVFSRMYSYGGATEFSFRSVLTGLTQREETVSRTSFVSILKKHGFWCGYYTENVEDMTKSRVGDMIAGKYLNERKVLSGPIRSVADQVKARINENSGKCRFVFVQNGTGHYPYVCDSEFRIYTPSAIKDGKDDKDCTGMKNDYDNCIHAVDVFLSEIIGSLQDKNAVVLYSSDHGELLGEGGKWHHGDADNPYLRHVPAFIWFSDEYKSKHPELVHSYIAVKDKLLVHGQFFASILKLCGVKTSVPLNVLDFVDDDILKHPHNLPDSVIRCKD